jgi:hypothetical protein
MATFNNARNILVGASPLFLSVKDSTVSGYTENMEPDTAAGVEFEAGDSYIDTLNAAAVAAGAKFRNVGFTNNGLQITYNPSYGSVTVDQLLDTAKLFKESMEVMIATEMSEGTLENILAVFGQGGTPTEVTGANAKSTIGLEAGALGVQPTERQLIAVGAAPTVDDSGENITRTERVYYGRRVLSVQQSQFSLARNAATTFPVTFRLLPDGNKTGSEYGLIIDRVVTA